MMREEVLLSEKGLAPRTYVLGQDLDEVSMQGDEASTQAPSEVVPKGPQGQIMGVKAYLGLLGGV